MEHFNREKLSNNDVNSAMENLNYGSIMKGMKHPYTNKYNKNSSNWELENKPLKIKEELKKLELSHFKDIYPVGIEVDWLSVGGLVPKTEKTLGLVSKKNPLIEIENEQKLRKIDVGKGNSILVKEVAPNILSQEAEKFLNSFFRILEE